MGYCILEYKKFRRKEIVEKYPIGGLGIDQQFSLDGEELFSGIILSVDRSYERLLYSKKMYIKGEVEMQILKTSNSNYIDSIAFYSSWNSNGYELIYFRKSSLSVQVFDMEASIEYNDININNNSRLYNDWKGFKDPDDAPCYTGDRNIVPYYNLQNEIKSKTIRKDVFDSSNVRYIAGIDVGYDELDLKMVAAVVIYDSYEKKVIEKEVVYQDILFNYCNDLFSYREVPLLKKAFEKLRIRPDLLLCKSHGIAHPRYVGLATHLGVELDIPAIGCARDRVLGIYEELNKESGNSQDLIWRGEIVGKAYRMINNEKPVFISIGHKITLETACNWCSKLQKENKKNAILPFLLIEAEDLVNSSLEERTHVEFIQTEI